MSFQHPDDVNDPIQWPAFFDLEFFGQGRQFALCQLPTMSMGARTPETPGARSWRLITQDARSRTISLDNLLRSADATRLRVLLARKHDFVHRLSDHRVRMAVLQLVQHGVFGLFERTGAGDTTLNPQLPGRPDAGLASAPEEYARRPQPLTTAWPSDRLSPTRVTVPAPVQTPQVSKTRCVHILVEVVGEDGKGLPDVALVLRNGAGGVLNELTASGGIAVFKGLDPGTYQLGLDELDQDAWALVERGVDEGRYEEEKSAWTSAAIRPSAPFVHRVRQGECASKIAYEFGFNPNTIWMHASNAEIRAARQNLYILAEGDQLYIPEKSPKYEIISATSRIKIIRKGVPERLHVRFLDRDQMPRKNIGFFVELKTANATMPAPFKGQTDAQGFLNIWLPPDSISAKIHLFDQVTEIYNLDIGHLDPAASISGWQARLCNLGYSCGEEVGSMGPRTREAITRFQSEMGLERSGAMDESTRQHLMALALA